MYGGLDSDEDDGEGSDDEILDDDKRFKAQRINLLFFTLAMICENSYKFALTLVSQKDVIDKIASFMQVSGEKSSDQTVHRRLVKGASVLVASLSGAREEGES